MANFKSDLITAKDQVNISDKALSASFTGTLPLIQTVSYILTGTCVANDTLQLLDLPPGAVLLPQLSSVTCADPGTALTLDIGDITDTDRYADDIVLSNGGIVEFASQLPVPAGIITPKLTTENSRVFATVKTATALTAGVKLTFLIAYRING